MSTIFLGTSEFAAGVLARLASEPAHRPLLVLTRPDRPSGRGRKLTAPPVALRARELGLRVEQPESVNDDGSRALIAEACAASGDTEPTLIVCAFGALIKEPLLSEHAILNVHPSLLPRWRGAAPIERAIMAGDESSGVSIMRLTAGLDSGPVCLVESAPIEPEETYGTLAVRLERLGGELLVRALDESPPFHEQPEDGVTYAEKIGADDRLIDAARPALDGERLVRALSPHIGARLALADGTLLGVRSARALAEQEPAPCPAEEGSDPLFAADGRLLLGCSPGLLELLEVQPPGGRAMDAGSYLRGHGAPGRR